MDKFKAFAEAGNRLIKSCERVRETLIELDDSIPKVWLTVEEAILAKKCARYVAGYLAKDEEARKVWMFADKLNERISQAECKDESNSSRT